MKYPEIQKLNVRITPFVHTSWVSDEAKRRWERPIARASEVFWQTEIQTVAEGLRSATTANIHAENWQGYMDIISRFGLVFTPIRRVKRYSGFTHTHEHAENNDPNAMIYGCITRNKEDGEAFKAYETGHITAENGALHPQHRDIAGLLGYPECCKSEFWHVWAELGMIDTPFHQAWNTPGREEVTSEIHELHNRHFPVKTVYVKGHSHAAQHLRYLGVRITPHLPHSYTCQETIEWGKAWLDVMRSIDRKAADDILMLMQMPVRWTAFKGIGTLDTPIFRAAFNTLPCFPELQVLYESENDDILYTLPNAAKGTDFPFVRYGIMKNFRYLQARVSTAGLKIKDLKKPEAEFNPDEFLIERIDEA